MAEEKPGGGEELPDNVREQVQRIIDQVRAALEAGCKVALDRSAYRAKIRCPGEPQKSIKIPREAYDEVAQMIRQLREEVKAREQLAQDFTGGEEESGEERPRRGRPPTLMTDLGLWTTFVKRQRPLLEGIIYRVAWLQDAVMDIGLNTLLFVLASDLGEPTPEDLQRVLGEIHSSDQLVNYVMDRLMELYAASKGEEQVPMLMRRIKELEVENALLRQYLKRLKTTADKMRRLLDIAIASMDMRSLREFTTKAMLLGFTVREGAAPGPQAGGESVGAGGESGAAGPGVR